MTNGLFWGDGHLTYVGNFLLGSTLPIVKESQMSRTAGYLQQSFVFLHYIFISGHIWEVRDSDQTGGMRIAMSTEPIPESKFQTGKKNFPKKN